MFSLVHRGARPRNLCKALRDFGFRSIAFNWHCDCTGCPARALARSWYMATVAVAEAGFFLEHAVGGKEIMEVNQSRI